HAGRLLTVDGRWCRHDTRAPARCPAGSALEEAGDPRPRGVPLHGEPLDEPFDVRAVALRLHLHPAVGHVAGMPDQAQLPGPGAGPPAEPHPLAPAADVDECTLHGPETTVGSVSEPSSTAYPPITDR